MSRPAAATEGLVLIAPDILEGIRCGPAVGPHLMLIAADFLEGLLCTPTVGAHKFRSLATGVPLRPDVITISLNRSIKSLPYVFEVTFKGGERDHQII